MEEAVENAEWDVKSFITAQQARYSYQMLVPGTLTPQTLDIFPHSIPNSWDTDPPDPQNFPALYLKFLEH